MGEPIVTSVQQETLSPLEKVLQTLGRKLTQCRQIRSLANRFGQGAIAQQTIQFLDFPLAWRGSNVSVERRLTLCTRIGIANDAGLRFGWIDKQS